MDRTIFGFFMALYVVQSCPDRGVACVQSSAEAVEFSWFEDITTFTKTAYHSTSSNYQSALSVRFLACGCLHSPTLERLLGGTEREPYRDGRFDEKQMAAAFIARTDLFETARQQAGTNDLSGSV